MRRRGRGRGGKRWWRGRRVIHNKHAAHGRVTATTTTGRWRTPAAASGTTCAWPSTSITTAAATTAACVATGPGADGIGTQTNPHAGDAAGRRANRKAVTKPARISKEAARQRCVGGAAGATHTPQAAAGGHAAVIHREPARACQHRDAHTQCLAVGGRQRRDTSGRTGICAAQLAVRLVPPTAIAAAAAVFRYGGGGTR